MTSSRPGRTESFTGPFFITGMPRSGTKLFAGLLDQHPSLGIPHRETTFLALWVRRFHRNGGLSDRIGFRKFYDWTIQLPYFRGMESDGCLFRMDEWYGSCSSFSVQGVFQALIRHDAGIADDPMKLWGCRSPAHIRQIPMLRKLYPGSRVIHVVRDVRDHCISMQKAWGKHPLRSAQRWRDDVIAAREDGLQKADNYLEVRYEDLLEDAEKELRRVCDFLGVGFDPAMLALKKPVESTGDARGQRDIVASNKGKYNEYFTSGELRSIEKIAADALSVFGYHVPQGTGTARVGPLRMLVYRLFDALSMMRVSVSKLGFSSALKRNIDSLRMKWS